MAQSILLIDDNVALVASLRHLLNGSYKVNAAHTAAAAIKYVINNTIQCVVLDLKLPDLGGYETCKKLRAIDATVPIIILTGDDSINQKLRLFDAGADEYLIKPIDYIELHARIAAAIRRHNLPNVASKQMHMHDVTLHSSRHTVERDGKTIVLRPKEFMLLECLMSNAGSVVSRPILMQYAWNDEERWTNVVDVHIKTLRDKFDAPFNRALIKTIRGFGYKFDLST